MTTGASGHCTARGRKASQWTWPLTTALPTVVLVEREPWPLLSWDDRVEWEPVEAVFSSILSQVVKRGCERLRLRARQGIPPPLRQPQTGAVCRG